MADEKLTDIDPFDPELARLEELRAAGIEVDGNVQLDQFIRRRKQAYAAVFGDTTNEDVQFVIEDLAAFAKAFQPPFDPNPRVQDVLIGRMDVFYRIFEHVHLPVDTLYVRYTDALLKRKG
jgi:hypothetical protein